MMTARGGDVTASRKSHNFPTENAKNDPATTFQQWPGYYIGGHKALPE
jgi:hypothetical protein